MMSTRDFRWWETVSIIPLLYLLFGAVPRARTITLPPASFHPFPRLPPELRLEIWEYCAHVEPQVVPLPEVLRARRPLGPVLMRINRESRAVALKIYFIRLVVSSKYNWGPLVSHYSPVCLRIVYRLAPHDRIVYPAVPGGIHRGMPWAESLFWREVPGGVPGRDSSMQDATNTDSSMAFLPVPDLFSLDL